MASHVVCWDEAFPEACRGGAVTVGKFDGVHRGHAALVAHAVALARRVGGPAVAVTFDPHPLTLLRPDQATLLLTTPDDRAKLLHRAGADHVVTLRTTPELLALTAGDFFDRVLRGRLAARGMAEGPNFCFGRGREGDVALLARLCGEAGMELVIVPPVAVGGVEASSGRARAAVLRGDVRAAAELLGRPYRLRGIVGGGQKRGRTIGFPTANLDRVTTVVPADGVYAAIAGFDAARWPATVNVGGNPTFGEHARKLEAHLLGYEGDLYGKSVSLDFVERLRETTTFAGKDELVRQLHLDAERARAVLGEVGQAEA